MRKSSEGTDALAHLFYVRFCHPPDLAMAQAPSCWPTVSESHPKPRFTDDTEHASCTQCLHTSLLTPHKAISFDKLLPSFELPLPPATREFLASAVPCRTPHAAHPTPPQKRGHCGAEPILPLHFPSSVGVLGRSRTQELLVPRPVIKLSLPLSHILIIPAGGHANNINAAE